MSAGQGRWLCWGWNEGWLVGRRVGPIGGCLDNSGRGSLNICFCGWLYSRDKGSGDGWLKGWLDGCVVGRKDGLVDGYEMGLLGSYLDG